jgi:hypothetical protein
MDIYRCLYVPEWQSTCGAIISHRDRSLADISMTIPRGSPIRYGYVCRWGNARNGAAKVTTAATMVMLIPCRGSGDAPSPSGAVQPVHILYLCDLGDEARPTETDPCSSELMDGTNRSPLIVLTRSLVLFGHEPVIKIHCE